MCKEERFNSLSGPNEKNSIILGTQLTCANSAVTPKSKICPSTQLSEAFYSQAPQTYSPPKGLLQLASTDFGKVKNLSHPFMTEFVS